MRLTVTRRIIGSISLLILVASIALFIIHDGLAQVTRAMDDLAEVKQPSYSATLEIELNVNGSVMAAFAYLTDPDARYREIVRKDQQDIAVFSARLGKLARTDAERQHDIRLRELVTEIQAVITTLMDSRDRQATEWAAVTRSLERADSIIDFRLQARVEPSAPTAAQKLAALAGLEADLAEVGVLLGTYQRSQDPEHRTMITANIEEFRTSLRHFRSLPLLDAEVRHVATLDQTFERMVGALAPLWDINSRLRQHSARLIDLRSEIDQLLDEEIQAIARQGLSEPREDAARVASTVLRRIQWLGILVLLAAVTTAGLLIRSVVRPIRQLRTGAKTVGRGDLSHRITLSGGSKDEFAELAAEFNRMVEQLQATTVSKTLLERSEHELLETVAQLRQQIAGRLRSEEERHRLEASLRRSETMSAMGALVGGVAHEVRNPLFGILSVLDTMEERFGTRAEYQRYLLVLREQAQRLERLMRELLEYGTAPNRELAPGSISDVLEEALANSRSVAEHANVRLVSHITDGLAPVLFDRNRLLRVFINLLENAIQFSPSDGPVTLESQLRSEQGTDWIELTVSDTGPGFRGEDLPHLFQPFFTRRHGGTGLGLSIVQRIVEEHGGQVTAENRREGGAVVTVRLPVYVSVLFLSPARNPEAENAKA